MLRTGDVAVGNPPCGRSLFPGLAILYKHMVYNRTRAHAPAKVSSIDNFLSLYLLNKQASYC